jgi:hypothetical protein
MNDELSTLRKQCARAIYAADYMDLEIFGESYTEIRKNA